MSDIGQGERKKLPFLKSTSSFLTVPDRIIPKRYEPKVEFTSDSRYIQEPLIPIAQRDILGGMLAEIRSLYRFGNKRYELFTETQARKDVVDIGVNLAAYLHDQGINRIVFIDRSARPGYIALRECWERMYPKQELPQIYFVNPLGFNTPEDMWQPGYAGAPKFMEVVVKAEQGGESVAAALSMGRGEDEIGDELRDAKGYKKLMRDKKASVLIFDNCLHTGQTIGPVKRAFDDVGFESVKIGIVSEIDNLSGKRPDFVALDHEPEFGCDPFHADRMIEKTSQHVFSRRVQDRSLHKRSIALRTEIKRIVGEHFDRQAK